MALVFRTSSIANVGATTIKNSALTYEEGDGNFAYLLTNMSGSNINITGDTLLTGQLQLDGNVFFPQLTSASQNNVLTYNTSSGRIYYTSSTSIAPVPNLQQVTAINNTTTNGIISKQSGLNPAYVIVENAGGTQLVEMGYQNGTGPTFALYQSFSNFGMFKINTLTGARYYTMPDQSGEMAVWPYTGSARLTGSLGITGSLSISGLTSTSQTDVLTYNSSTGQVFFTASSAVGEATINTGSFLTTGSLLTTQQLSGSLNITGSLNFFSGSTNVSKIENGWVVLTYVSKSLDFANDTAAAAGGVPLGGLYRNGNAISIRIA